MWSMNFVAGLKEVFFIRGKRETLELNDCGAAEWAGMEGGENAGREAVRFATQHHACTSGMASSPA